MLLQQHFICGFLPFFKAGDKYQYYNIAVLGHCFYCIERLVIS